ncbi:MAG: ATP-binding protein, partial [Acidobacteriota bacterium]
MIPPTDPIRVAALERYGILDTPSETTFDIITTMLSEMLQVPHACVSLVDRNRVWFKSTVGVEVREVDREAGFCSTLVVTDEDVRHIEDASEHPETEGNSLVCGESGIRFYAGAPLCTPDGHRIGTLCAFGPTPRGITDTERTSLRNLATLVMHEIELRSMRQRLERTEAALRQAQRLESVGLVASGVAHDFNNLLSGILGNAQLLRRRLDGNEDGQELLNEIETTGRRAADLVEQVLAYAGRGEDSPSAPTDLNALVYETHHMVQASIDDGTEIDLDLADGLPAVLGQSTGLRQLVLNLLTNASEACGEAGKVQLATRLDTTTGRIVMTVGDNGHGIADEAKERIFEPFFSSKTGGRGLGLAICHRIVEQHTGTIEVESEI